MKFQKSLLLGLCAAASLVGAVIPTIASAEVSVYFRSPPPPVRVEVTPAPRRGYVWVSGYWDLKRDHHVWQRGHWERARAGHYYSQPTWVQRDNRWELRRGEWRRGDQDRDGIPDRLDRDRDGDGVPNRRDDAPDNPNRR